MKKGHYCLLFLTFSILLVSEAFCASLPVYVSNPLKPNPSTSLAKRKEMLCANFGQGAFVLNTESGEIHWVATQGIPNNIFAWGTKYWGLIVGNKLFKWDGIRETADLFFSGDQPITNGLEVGGRIFLLRNGDIIELMSDGKPKVITNYFKNMRMSELGWRQGKLTVFGDGVFSIEMGTTPVLPRLIAKGHGSTTGMALPGGRIIKGGGGWPALIVDEAETKGTILDYNKRATYDQIDDFDWENDKYWIGSDLTDEGAMWTGKSIFRSYPSGESIELEDVYWKDFKVIGSTIYLATDFGVLRIAVDGASTLYTRTGSWESIINRNDLYLHPHLTFDNFLETIRIIGGFNDALGKSGSFLIIYDPSKGWQRRELPIEGLREMRVINTKVLLAGHRTQTYEGGEWEHFGGLAVLNKNLNPKILSNKPMTLLDVKGNSLVSIGYEFIGDSDDCYKEIKYQINLKKESVAELNSSTICREGYTSSDPQAVFIRDTARFEKAKKYFNMENSEPISLSIEIDPVIKSIPISTKATSIIEEITAKTIPLTNIADAMKEMRLY